MYGIFVIKTMHVVALVFKNLSRLELNFDANLKISISNVLKSDTLKASLVKCTAFQDLLGQIFRIFTERAFKSLSYSI